MSYRDLDIKRSYISYGENSIADSLLVPALKQTKLYRRSVGFFSSSVFTPIFDGVIALFRNEGKIQLVASPNLTQEDITAINIGYENREQIISSVFTRDFLDAIDQLNDNNLLLLAELIAKGIMDIKLVVTNGVGIYHDKLGIMEDFDGNTIVFYGSSNASLNGYKNNYEKIRVVKRVYTTNLII